MHFICLALSLLALTAPAPAADPTDDHDDSWIQQYYLHPTPERFENEVHRMQTTGALHSDQALPPLAEFFSRLFHTAPPAQLAQWLKVIAALPETDRRPFLIALRWAETPESQAALQAIAAGDGNPAIYAHRLQAMSVPALEKLTNPGPSEIDMCWAAFMATGDPVYALVVIRCAVGPAKKDDDDNANRQAAQWSLQALCRTHPKLRDIKDAFYQTATPGERQVLDELFDAPPRQPHP